MPNKRWNRCSVHPTQCHPLLSLGQGASKDNFYGRVGLGVRVRVTVPVRVRLGVTEGVRVRLGVTVFERVLDAVMEPVRVFDGVFVRDAV